MEAVNVAGGVWNELRANDECVPSVHGRFIVNACSVFVHRRSGGAVSGAVCGLGIPLSAMGRMG